ncbi:hypothetical protein Trydic_g3542 [Trypoxylus dichotomus]
MTAPKETLFRRQKAPLVFEMGDERRRQGSTALRVNTRIYSAVLVGVARGSLGKIATSSRKCGVQLRIDIHRDIKIIVIAREIEETEPYEDEPEERAF